MGFASGRTAAGLLVVVLAIATLLRHEHAHTQLLHPGEPLGSLSVATLNGQPATLAAAGRPTIIHVFATWCGPCQDEAPAFAAVAQRLQRRGVQVVDIDQQESAERVAAFARYFGIRYPVYLDLSNVTHDVLGARMIPNTIYVDANGVIRWQHAGPLSTAELSRLEHQWSNV